MDTQEYVQADQWVNRRIGTYESPSCVSLLRSSVLSLYAEYIRERENKQIVETEQGFATYYFTNGGCYIQDLYVKPEYRKSGVAAKLADQIVEIAKENSVHTLIGSVSPQATNPTDSLKVLLAYGFKLHSVANNLILMTKEI